jgi:N-acetylmuramoyl-L-alanine amidase
MFLRRKRILNEKAVILREIYYDNLRMAGKYIETGRRLPKWHALIKPLQTLAVLLVVALFPFSELDPALYVSDKPSLHAMPPAYSKMIERVPYKSQSFDTSVPFTTAVSRPGEFMDIPPVWNFTVPETPGLNDYNLLLSGNDKVRLSALFGLGIKTIVIDPGHGGRDPGAIGAMGTMEKEITLDVALKLKERLGGPRRYNVLLTREKDRTLSLADRVQFAKDNNADIFISIHVNSLPDEKLNIIETYYFGAPLNSDTIRLAEAENKESHFSVAELDAIIQDFGNTLKRQESAKLATAIQVSLFKNLKYQDAQLRDFGIKMAPFVVLSQIEVPSVLVEISCITKAREEVKLASSKYRTKIASYMEEGIVAYLESQDFQLSRGEN